MSKNRSKLFRLSRSRFFLWKLCVGTVLLGIAGGYLAGLVNWGKGSGLRAKIEAYVSANASEFTVVSNLPDQMAGVVLELLDESLRNEEFSMDELLEELPYLRFWIQTDSHDQLEAVFSRHLDEEKTKLCLLLLKALGSDPNEAQAELTAMADADPPRRYANQALGIIANSIGQYNVAYPFFLKEGGFPDADWAREEVVRNRYERKDFSTLNELSKEPDYGPAIKPWMQADLAAFNNDWLNTLRWTAVNQFHRIKPGSFVLSTIGMLIWGMILYQLCQASRLDKWTPLLCVAGLLLGILSITPTHLWIILEDRFLPISQGDDFFHNAVYYIATVGLREEVCKLLLFLPVAPILIRRGNQLEFLLVASFVGLGFAYQENLAYAEGTMGTALTARFLTANFLHISLTGMSGLFFCRAWRTTGYSYNDFLYIFGIAIVAHGMYDALLTYPLFQDEGILPMILYVLFSKFYFQETHRLRESGQPPVISLSATMSFGMSLLVAGLVVYLSFSFSLSQAIQLAFTSFLGSAIILFMFFREFDEALSD